MMPTTSLYAVPAELRALKNWVLWKYVKVEGTDKLTKVPYQINGNKASVTDESHWSHFNDCINAIALGSYDGLGFVFSNTKFSGIDLDDCSVLVDGSPNPNYQLDLDRQIKISQSFDSYSEVSPSGKGLHIIVEGSVPAGRRRNKIEIYSDGRFFTMTGNVHNNKPISNQQELLTSLWEQMGNPVSASAFKGDEHEKEPDEAIIRKATDAVNGDKFKQLYSGDWQNLYTSQSEADFAIIDIISFYTQNKNQIARIFSSSQLGRRDKAKRKDYVNGMIQRSFDRMLPNVDIDGIQNAVELKLAQAQLALPLAVSSNGRTSAFDAENVGSNPTAVANGSVAQWSEPAAHNGLVAGSSPVASTNLPPGLLGDLAQFIFKAAPRPVPEVALAAAIGLMAGITGRAYNVSGTGLNQYILLLAMTGAGKEAAAEGIDKLMATIKMQVPTSTTFIGPGEIPSGTGLFRHLANNSQSFVSLLGEFGLKLQQISSPTASSSELSLRRLILDLYNKSGFNRSMPASSYAKKEDSSNAISSPAFTILGESTPERFYGVLNEDMISEGLLPRFLLIEYKGKRPPLNEQHSQVQVPFSLIEKLAALCAQCETINHSNPRRIINVGATDIAARMLSDFDKYADSKINGSNKEVIRQLWNRAHMKVLKLSALIAVGENMIEPIIIPSYMEWAAKLVYADINALTDRFETGEIGNNSFEIKQSNEIVRMIKDYTTASYETISKYMPPKCTILHNDKIIPYAYLSRRLIATSVFRTDKAGATIAIKRAIQNLVDSDRIKELGKAWTNDKYGTSQRCFVIADLSILD